jgi:hypothetical protein
VVLALLATVLAASAGAAWTGTVATLATPATVKARSIHPPPPGGDDSRRPVLELELGPRTRGADEAVLRVFLGAPQANAATPLGNPGYVGSISPMGGDGRRWAGQRFALPLADALARLAARSGADTPPRRALTITVVPVPLRGSAGKGIAVEVASAAILWR